MRYRLNKIFRTFLASAAILASVRALGQEDKLILAQELMKRNQPDSALLLLDSVIRHPMTKNDFVSWTTRAYVYNKIYSRTDKLKLNSALRDSIVNCLRTSDELKPDSTNQENNKRLYKNLGGGYYKIAKHQLEDSLNYEKSLEAFNRYKVMYVKGDPGFNFETKEIEYYLTVGSVFSNIFNNDNKNVKAGETAKVALLKVLEKRPNDTHANLNLGLMYYNQAVALVKALDEGLGFAEIDIVQDNMIKLAKQSLHLINNVYVHEPENQKAIQALYYIYRMLNETAKHEEFKIKAKERNIDIGEKRMEENKDNNNQQNKDK